MNTNRRIIILLLALLAAMKTFSQEKPSFHIVITGNAPKSALLIPGFGCSGKVWDETVAQLSKDYTCYVVTFAGFAGQQAQDSPHLKTWVNDLAAYIIKNKLSHPVVIGHSIGGGMALWLAAAHPELVSKLVIVDALPCLAAVQSPGYKVQANPDCSSMVTRYTSMSDTLFRQIQEKTMPALCADTNMQKTLVAWSMIGDRKTMGQIYCEFINTDLRDTLARISCPVLVLLEPSFKRMDTVMQQQYAGLKNKQILYANKGLHFIMNDDKEWYLQQLRTDLP